MPWDTGSVEKHYGGLDEKHKKMWVGVANSALKSCLDKGGDAKECEVSAIKQASSVVKKSLSENNKIYRYLFEIKDSDVKELEEKNIIDIEVFREGQWTHPKWGIIKGTKKLFNDFISNWKKNVVGREIIFDQNHKPENGGTGIVKNLFIDEDRLKATVELTNFGIDLIKNKGFRYFSPEYTDKYINKETGEEVQNVLIGGGLTLRPFLTNLSPIVLSEQFSEDIEVFQKCEDKSDIELKEELWKSLQEYANHDEGKIKNIMDIMEEHMQEALEEMKSDNGKIMVKDVIQRHMGDMMREIMDNMTWIKNHPMSMEVKDK